MEEVEPSKMHVDDESPQRSGTQRHRCTGLTAQQAPLRWHQEFACHRGGRAHGQELALIIRPSRPRPPCDRAIRVNETRRGVQTVWWDMDGQRLSSGRPSIIGPRAHWVCGT